MQMISSDSRIIGTGVFILLFVYTIFLLRSNKLTPQHAMSWIIAELTMLVLILFDPILLAIVRLIGADNASDILFLLATIWGVLLMLDLLVRISELTTKLRAVNQELALLGERFDKLQQSLNKSDTITQQ